MISPEAATVQATQALGFIHKHHLCADPTVPLIYLVHGRAGNVDVMWLFKRILPEKNANIISIQAPLKDPIGGWSWWDVSVDKNTWLEQADTNIKKAARFFENACDYYQLTPSNVIGLGFSQGSGVLSYASLAGLIRFDAIAILAGFVLPFDKEVQTGPKTLPSFFWGHGTADDTIPISRAYQDRDYLLSLGAQVDFHEEDVGHKIGSKTTRALSQWLRNTINS